MQDDLEFYLRIAGEPSRQIEEAVNAKAQETIDKLQSLFPNQKIKSPEIKYDLKGHTAGYAIGGHTIRMNLDLLFDSRYFQEQVNVTLPHEMCHIVDVQMHGKSSHHGYRWQHLMYSIGLEPTRCHNFETKAARKRSKLPKDQIYYCSCGEHPVTIILHNRMQSGKKYTCRTCGTRLRESE